MPFFDGEELERWSGGKWEQERLSGAHGVSTDTRTLEPGCLYVALKGKTFDGHAFVKRALEKGAAAALVGHDYPAHAAGPHVCLLRVDDTLAALQGIAVGYRRCMDIEVVGITGSAGKTTVKEMTADVLSAVAPVARTIGNLNNDIGVPLSLLAMERTARFGVFEVGTNHPGELGPLCAMIGPQWGVVTNVGPVHIEFFGSVAAVAAEKGEMLKALPDDGTAVLCRDDEFFNTLRSSFPGRVVDVSMHGGADYSFAGMSGDEVMIKERAGGEVFRFRPPVPGNHNILNAMYAIAVGRGHGMEWDGIRRAIEKYSPPPMRWEREVVCGVTLINDGYNANPMSMKAAIETFGRMASPGRKWLVVGGMLELGVTARELHEEVGRRIGGGDWAGLLVIGECGSWIADGARGVGFDERRIVLCRDNDDAVRALIDRTKENDVVLLKASRGMHIEEVRNKYVLLAL